jgi:hypothetical protein
MLFCIAAIRGYGQKKPAPPVADPSAEERVIPVDTVSKDRSDGDRYMVLPNGATCKSNRLAMFLVTQKQPLPRIPKQKKGSPSGSKLLTVHGNILYDFDYWSQIDTPYAERNVNQQTLQTYLDLQYKNAYPFRVYFTTRWNNSSFFRNFTDVNFLFNAADFNNRVKKQVKDLLRLQAEADSLPALEKRFITESKKQDSLRNWLSDPTQLQRLAAEQERRWLKRRRMMLLKDSGAGADSTKTQEPVSLPDLGQIQNYKFNRRRGGKGNTDSLAAKADQLDSSFAMRYDSAKKALDSLDARLAVLKKQYEQEKKIRNRDKDSATNEIDHITSGEELKEKLREWRISDTSLPKGYSTLYSIRSFGVGRTMLNYSELSAKNVSINGMQVEYNPSYYAAFAIGSVDYRFRDYNVQNAVKGQYIGLARYGWGRKDGNSVILTYYEGKRQLYNAYTTPQGTNIPNYSLMGFTLEGRYKLTRTTTLIAEAAKSSSPYYSLDSIQAHNVLGSALRWSDRTNEAWSVKLNSFLPRTQTAVDAAYSNLGANFQSFSLFTTGSRQTAWSIKVNQPLLKRRLLVTAGIRTNDFTNPLLNSAYKSSTLFESIQATLRAKKLPVISLGYFPSSQVIRLGDGQYQENLFYTLNANISHAYKAQGISMLSMLMYTQFYNKVRDTGFVYYNTKNLLFSQSIFIHRLTAQLQASAAMSVAYYLYVVDGKADYRVTSWLTLGAGLKYNEQTVYNVRQWGYSGNAAVRVPKIGEFRLTSDKGFIPGNNRRLVVNKTGRLTYTKVF